MRIDIPYHREKLSAELPDERVKAVLRPSHRAAPEYSEQETVQRALAHPIASLPLSALARKKRHILVITSDHTRPMPSRITLPLLLEELRHGSPEADIRILVATGLHRPATAEELRAKFGDDICRREHIIIHDAFDDAQMVFKGTLPSGGALRVNALVDWADLLLAEGFIEPHFFAGFSGGRKSVLPGICAAESVMYNHNAAFIAHPHARAGMLEGNPLHQDMLFAARAARLSFILNVTLDENKRITAAFAGDMEAAHLAGCAAVLHDARVNAVKADIVLTGNGGYPLDQNMYQAVKCMTTAESCLNEGGVIIAVSACSDGHGGEGFYNWFSKSATPWEITQKIAAIPPDYTLPDQWQAQVLARVLQKCRAAILVSRHIDPQIIRGMHMLPARSIDEAFSLADTVLGLARPAVIIPDGVGIIPE